MRKNWFLAAVLLFAMLGGCDIRYELVPARLAIVDVSHDGYAQVAATVHDLMIKEGFEYLGRAGEIISFIHGDTKIPDTVKRELLARLERERTYENERCDLRVVLSNYVDGVPGGDLPQFLAAVRSFRGT